MKAITNIQKFSIHDGDGIRTTVFFKGCPLHCTWCHNPETQCYNPEVEFDSEKCVGCGSCIGACHAEAISIVNGKAFTDSNKCDRCDKCGKMCPSSARRVMGKEYEPKALVKELMKDLMFYEESGGGVTLSGGEVMMMDIDYLIAIAKELKRNGISLFIDTCGYVPYERLSKILPYTDTFLYDLKCMDDELHKKYTGVSNEKILDNLARLSKDGARIYVRIPVIKEVNGNEKNMQDTIKFLQDNGIHPAKINLLPYHDAGVPKYSKIGMVYEGHELHAPFKEEMEKFAELFIKAGFINTKIGG